MKSARVAAAAMFLCFAIALAQQPADTTASAPASGGAPSSTATPCPTPSGSSSGCPVQVTINNNPVPTPSPSPTPRPPKGSINMEPVYLNKDCPCPDAKKTAAIAKILDSLVPGAHVTAADPGILAIVWDDAVSREAVDYLKVLAQNLNQSAQPPSPDSPAPKSPKIVTLKNHKAQEIAHKLDNSVPGITVAAIPNDADDALVLTWDKDPLAAAVPDLLKIIDSLDAADTVGSASSHIIRLYNTRKASEIAKILNNFQSGTQKITVANQGEDVLVLTGSLPGSEIVIDELKRYVAVLDLPRPQLALNLWSVQVSSGKLEDVNKDAGRIRQAVNSYNSLLGESYDRGWRVITHLRDHADSWDWLDASFHNYVGQRFISCSPFYQGGDGPANATQLCFAEDRYSPMARPEGALSRAFLHACKKGEYCLGYTFAFDPLKASLTNLFFALAAADRPGPLAEEIVKCMESADPNCGSQAGKKLLQQHGLYPYQFKLDSDPNMPQCRFVLEPEGDCKSKNQESADAEAAKANEVAANASQLRQAASSKAAKAQAAKIEANAAVGQAAAKLAEAREAARKAARVLNRQAAKAAADTAAMAENAAADAAKAAEKAGAANEAAQRALQDADAAKTKADQAVQDADAAKAKTDQAARDAFATAPQVAGQAAQEAAEIARLAQAASHRADQEPDNMAARDAADAAARAAQDAANTAKLVAQTAAGVVSVVVPQADCEMLDQQGYQQDKQDYERHQPNAEEDKRSYAEHVSRELHFACLGYELQNVFASGRRTGLMRAAIADFLFHYKMSVQYPHDFVAYDLSHSADTLDSYFHPLLTAYNHDIAALLRFLQDDKLQPVSKDFASEGIVSVSVISGNPASVDAKTANSFESTTPFTIAEFLNQLKAAESSTPALLKNNLTAEEANAIVAAFNVQKPTNISIGRDLSLTATAFSLATGSAADLKVTMASKDDGQPQQTFQGGTKNDINPSRVAAHTVDTTVRVESTKLFDLSSLSARLTYRGNSWPVPIVGELPWIGPAFRWPGSVHKVFHRSFAIISAVIVPNATDLAEGMPFTGDRILGIPAPTTQPCQEPPPPKCPTGSCVKPEKKCPAPPERQTEKGTAQVDFATGFHAKALALDSLYELPTQVREFHKEKLRCFINNDSPSTCKDLNFENFPEGGKPGDKNAEEP
jgi:chemotaxis protein histidine kinase CheA